LATKGVNYAKFVNLAQKYDVQSHILSWAGLLRYLGQSRPDGFTVEDWYDLTQDTVDRDIIVGFLRLLEESSLIKADKERYVLLDDHKLQRVLEDVNLLLETHTDGVHSHADDKLLWTIPLSSELPKKLTGSFNHLNGWLQHTIQSATQHVLFFAPFFTVAGITTLEPSISALLRNRTELIMDWVTSNLEIESNQRAFQYLRTLLNDHSVRRIRVFQSRTAADDALWLHAKFVIVDYTTGYLGSANFSRRALTDQFEVGVPLKSCHAKALVDLIQFWIDTGELVEASIV
jgi:hypothetical protein